MNVQLRPIAQEDVANCGRICYQAFKEISEQHGFRPDFSSPDVSTQMLQSLADDPAVFGIVAESNGKVIGSNFLWQHDAIAGIGPITIDSQAQSQGVGRLLMQAVLEHGSDCRGIRLVQDAFNLASFSLYSSLDFDVKEPLVLIEGLVKAPAPPDYELRKMRAGDFDECGGLCNRSIGTDRTHGLKRLPPFLSSFVAGRGSRIVAYAAAPHSWAYNHSVAETQEDLQALLIGVGQFSGELPLSLLLPTRQSRLLRWCLSLGMRVIKPMTLMARGEYQEPQTCYTPSVIY